MDSKQPPVLINNDQLIINSGLATSKLVFQALKAGQSVEAIAKQYDLSVDAVLDLKETFF